MTPQWRDVSGYSRGERGVIEPVSWELDGPLRVVVTRRHGERGWFVTSYTLNSNHTPLGSPNIDDAKAEAIELIRTRLTALLGSLPPAPRVKRRAK